MNGCNAGLGGCVFLVAWARGNLYFVGVQMLVEWKCLQTLVDSDPGCFSHLRLFQYFPWKVILIILGSPVAIFSVENDTMNTMIHLSTQCPKPVNPVNRTIPWIIPYPSRTSSPTYIIPYVKTGHSRLPERIPHEKISSTNGSLSHTKNPPTFHCIGWLIGILLMVYYNPYITW